MKLLCPGCGLVASAEAWVNDAACRQTLDVCCKLPSPLPTLVLPYLSLFRPAKSALGWGKALRISRELAELVGKGWVQVETKPSRKCPPRIWAMAIEEMLTRRDRLTRPMPNHNYLRDVVYTLADREDAANEKKVVEAERSGNIRSLSDEENDAVAYAAMSYEQWNMLPPSVRKRHQHLRGK